MCFGILEHYKQNTFICLLLQNKLNNVIGDDTILKIIIMKRTEYQESFEEEVSQFSQIKSHL